MIVSEERRREDVRKDSATDGSEQEHGVVHVSRRMDDILIHSIHIMASRSFSLQLLFRHGLDPRSSLSFFRMFSLSLSLLVVGLSDPLGIVISDFHKFQIIY